MALTPDSQPETRKPSRAYTVVTKDTLDAYVDRSKGVEHCWVWKKGKNPLGYGQLRLSRTEKVQAHRYVYELIKGPIPEGLELDHLCRNRACCNPEHLEPVTHRINILRGESPLAVNARKTHCVNGHPFTPENTYTQTIDGGKPVGRGCRICHREHNKRSRAKRKLKDLTKGSTL